MPVTPITPRSARIFADLENDVPIIDTTESFTAVVTKMMEYIIKAVDMAFSYEQLRTTFAGDRLRPLIQQLSDDCHHPAIVAALLAARYEFQTLEDDGTGLSDSRGYACEIVAHQFLTYLSEKELIDYLLYELPKDADSVIKAAPSARGDARSQSGRENLSENTPLLSIEGDRSIQPQLRAPKRATFGDIAHGNGTLMLETSGQDQDQDDIGEAMAGMNALEIAGIANAKKFLSQRLVQKIVDDIWNGNVIFWESMSVEAVKKPRAYNKRVADPFTRLRVPKYQKTFQVAFFISLLALYYAVLVQRNPSRITFTEVLLYLWLASYAYDEFGEIQDAGVLFYKIDFWSLWDVAIIVVGAAFLITRAIGLAQQSAYIIDMSFDILSMIALFLVPRICSVMSLNPYFGSLIPVLKEMTMAFVKFLPVIIVLYLGFLTTFTMLARDRLSLNEMSWLLIKVFFGSSYLGFDVAVTISPALGYPLMLIFVTLTNILLLTALVSLVSNSLTECMLHAREEYLFQYSIYVLESSTSRRLTYFMPPLNLVPLLLLRPIRPILPSETARRIRIILLKATHIQFVALIWAYEGSRRLVSGGTHPPTARTSHAVHPSGRPLSAGLHPHDRSRDARESAKHAPGDAAGSVLGPSVSTSANLDGDLVSLMQKLSAQVDDLSAIVATLQKD